MGFPIHHVFAISISAVVRRASYGIACRELALLTVQEKSKGRTGRSSQSQRAGRHYFEFNFSIGSVR